MREKITFNIDYSRSDDKRYEKFLNDDLIEKDLTYSQVCLEQHRILEKMVEDEIISGESAFSLVGDIPAFNEFIESL